MGLGFRAGGLWFEVSLSSGPRVLGVMSRHFSWLVGKLWRAWTKEEQELDCCGFSFCWVTFSRKGDRILLLLPSRLLLLLLLPLLLVRYYQYNHLTKLD